MTSILSKDETETIEFFNSLTDGEMIEDLSAVFDDVSRNLQSKKFIECLEKVKAKFPNAQLHEMIEAAKEQLFDDE
ncbi:hypothetical protein [Vibrio nitrifigilis]|uniref:Uncharacterized protein n=1 Tax=Vibrio nitrifigilis TaxID=2789781 RepID=A0ABS0GID7_9VIBR|nr:hypothetical protein [Vibrio nitrifigilis]MBF9002090.1 hypothetical protein [Vibrio nitrifigilis]